MHAKNALPEYQRPLVEVPKFYDAAGKLIEYGNRWAATNGSPPEDSYSVDENTERFKPLHLIAEELIRFLSASYKVDVEEGTQFLEGFLHAPELESTSRVVRLTPHKQFAAPITLVFTNYPGVWVHAGMFFQRTYPSCGCNACDETWEGAADELETHILAIVGGLFGESVSPPRRPRWRLERIGRGFSLVRGMGQTYSHSLQSPDRSSSESGESQTSQIPKGRLEEGKRTLKQVHESAASSKAVPSNWAAWSNSKVGDES